ncbi:hypothetical protein [Methylocystis bryophila]|uniref:hypothetical protein n=1 Tax=Methylocystis bryophila TaxID=655015 RepID=UPI001319C033|nr:hypothetical protein [Methylocystis bryophila]
MTSTSTVAVIFVAQAAVAGFRATYGVVKRLNAFGRHGQRPHRPGPRAGLAHSRGQ